MYVCETCRTYESDVFFDWDPAEEYTCKTSVKNHRTRHDTRIHRGMQVEDTRKESHN